MRPIKTLTLEEAKQILEFVYPQQTPLGNPKDYTYWVEGLEFERTSSQVTFGGLPIIGIKYRGGSNGDGYLLPFEDSKVVLWLYKNNFDILEQLEANFYASDIENDFSNMAFEVESLSRGEEGYSKNMRHNWTLESVQRRCKAMLDKYYYKEYPPRT